MSQEENERIVYSREFEESVEELLLTYWKQWLDAGDVDSRERLHVKASVVQETIGELKATLLQETVK